MDVSFRNAGSGEVLVIPAFWDGGANFIVRFAPTQKGLWTYKTSCPQDSSPDAIQGEFGCVKYRGKLDLYKHGFVQAIAGTKYLFYADGTPFFYLGDTHWAMYAEEIDEAGPDDCSIS